MNIFKPHLAALLLIAFLLQSLSAYSTTKGLEVVEKTRLGSTPPSCHNKCNQCHPCIAVQDPTHERFVPSHKPSNRNPALMEFYDMPGPGNRYSNYKPLGWKCRCNNHLFNP